MLVSKLSLFFFYPSGQVSLSASYLTVFDASLKRNRVHIVMSPVFFLFFKGNFLDHNFLLNMQLRSSWHLSEELQFATLCTELSVSL